MPESVKPYWHIPNALQVDDIEFLKQSCKRHISKEGMPCYVMINNLESPTYRRIKETIENEIEDSLYYLNDFYMYTDTSFKTNWHVDTELYAFGRAINAWILLSPGYVDDPLGFIDGINDTSDVSFHSVRSEKNELVFGNYCTGDTTSRLAAEIESQQIHSPRIRLGDILAINPGRFHKTNTNSPKHAIAFKFVTKGPQGFLSDNQVDADLWPEVEIFNRLVKRASTWEGFLDNIRQALLNDADRRGLCAGFYPEKFELYRRMAASL